MGPRNLNASLVSARPKNGHRKAMAGNTNPNSIFRADSLRSQNFRSLPTPKMTGARRRAKNPAHPQSAIGHWIPAELVNQHTQLARTGERRSDALTAVARAVRSHARSDRGARRPGLAVDNTHHPRSIEVQIQYSQIIRLFGDIQRWSGIRRTLADDIPDKDRASFAECASAHPLNPSAPFTGISSFQTCSIRIIPCDYIYRHHGEYW